MITTMKKLQNSIKNIPYVQLKNDSLNLENNLKIRQRRIQNSIKHPRKSFFAKIVND